MSSLKVEGIDKLERDLRLVRDRATAGRLETILLRHARDLSDRIRPMAPRLTGAVQNAFQSFKARRRGSYIGGAITWIKFRAAPHINLIIAGTKAHKIKPKGKALTTPDGPRAGANHPGTPANQFFQRGVAQHGPAVADAAAREIADFMFGSGS